jgi:hypothetical protein
MLSVPVSQHVIGDKLDRLNVLKLLRMLRFARFYSATFTAFPDMHLFVQAVKQSRLAVVFLIIFISFAGIFFSSLLFFAETSTCHYVKERGKWFLGEVDGPVSPQDQLCTFQNIFEAAWFVMVTITTVGYGDVQLKSSLAKIITVVMMICSVIGLSLPVAIFGANLTELYLERRLVKKKSRMAQANAGVSCGSGKIAASQDELLMSIMTELQGIKRRLDSIERTGG